MVLAVTFAEVLDLMFSLLIGVMYGAVAWTVGTRKVSRAAHSANRSFATWWWGLVAVTFFGAIWTIVHWFVTPSIPVWMAYIAFILLVILVALAALQYYFLYLWSGKEGLWVPVAVFYMGLFVYFIYYIMLQDPTGFDAEGQVIYANDLSESTMATVIGILWLLPTVIGAGLYLSLLRRASDRLLRFRIGLVASSIMVWFLISITSSLSNVSEAPWWAYVSRIIAATVAVLTLIAYKPPASVRGWLRLEPEPAADAMDMDTDIVLAEESSSVERP